MEYCKERTPAASGSAAAAAAAAACTDDTARDGSVQQYSTHDCTHDINRVCTTCRICTFPAEVYIAKCSDTNAPNDRDAQECGAVTTECPHFQTAAVGARKVESGGVAADDELNNPCPICLNNEDDATVDGNGCGTCFACGQRYCGDCNTAEGIGQIDNCPTCRAPFIVSEEQHFKRVWKLAHDRSPGRHTPVAQNHLGTMYMKGAGTEQNYKEAVKWFRRAADQGDAYAKYNLGVTYDNGQGAPQDIAEAVKWYQLAAGQAHKDALHNLGIMQQDNDIPTPPPGTTITITLLTSAATVKYNNRTGKVVTRTTVGASLKQGRAAVLLNGEANPITFKLMNLRVFT